MLTTSLIPKLGEIVTSRLGLIAIALLATIIAAVGWTRFDWAQQTATQFEQQQAADAERLAEILGAQQDDLQQVYTCLDSGRDFDECVNERLREHGYLRD